jgi:hypothetical protein
MQTKLRQTKRPAGSSVAWQGGDFLTVAALFQAPQAVPAGQGRLLALGALIHRHLVHHSLTEVAVYTAFAACQIAKIANGSPSE